MIADQVKTIKELEMVVKGYESNLGEPLRAVREDVEREWKVKVNDEIKKREEKERWAEELVKQLEKEKQVLLFMSSFFLSPTDIVLADAHQSGGPSPCVDGIRD